MFITEEKFIDGFEGGQGVETRGRCLQRHQRKALAFKVAFKREPAFDLEKTKAAI